MIRLGQFRPAATTIHSRTGGTLINVTVNASAAANTLSKVVDRFDGTTIYEQVNAITEVTAAFSGTAPASFDGCLIGMYGQPNTADIPARRMGA